MLSPYSISSGMYQTYALDRDGKVHAFGRDSQGERSGMPTGGGYVAVAAASEGGYLLHTDGHVEVFGDKYGGLLTNKPDPTRKDFVKIAAGNYGGYGLTNKGYIIPFGDLATAYNAPVPTDGGYKDIAAGGIGGYALDATGHVVAIGNPADNRSKDLPTAGGFVQVVAGSKGGYALDATGHVVAFGDDNQAQRANLPGPTETFSWLSGGRYHGVGIKTDGTIKMWGDYGSEQRDGMPTPPAGERFVAVEGGYTTTAALLSDGSLRRWGGTGSQEDKDFPAPSVRSFGVMDRNAIDCTGATEIYVGATLTGAIELWFRERLLWAKPVLKPYTFSASETSTLLAAIKDAFDSTANAKNMPSIHIKQGQPVQFPNLTFTSSSGDKIDSCCWVTKDAPKDGYAPYAHALGDYDKDSVLRGYIRCWSNLRPGLWTPTGLGPGTYYACIGNEFDSKPDSLSGGFLQIVIDP